MDLSKRANLRGVREVRGLALAMPDSPTGMTGTDWSDLIDLRADSESDPDFWMFRGAASIVDHDYTVRDMFGEFTERIAPGAFDKTLSENPDVSLNYMHDMALTMVTTAGGNLSLTADPNLSVEARIPKDDVDAQRIMPKVQRGDARSMSFAFRVMQQVWDEDYTDRTITEVSLHRGDVAVIVSGLGANPAAWGTVRSNQTNSPFIPELRGDVPFYPPHPFEAADSGVCAVCNQPGVHILHTTDVESAQNSTVGDFDWLYQSRKRELALAELRNKIV